jgi:1,4-dihydroxy-2-naphthoyl-CoA hydrolase
MGIWRTEPTIAEIQEQARNTLAEHIDIRFTERGPDFLRATMPVKPSGVLHGGASVALAETVGSVAANLCVDRATQMCLGQEVNANHLRPVAAGLVTATARPYHIGSRSQVWHIEIRDVQDKLVCVSRLTMAVVPRNPGETAPPDRAAPKAHGA